MRGDGGVAGERRVVGVPKFHSWGKCTMPLTNINRLRLDVQRFLWPVYYIVIRESVDSRCRDGLNTLKAYLSAQASSFSGFVICKTRRSGQKLRGRLPFFVFLRLRSTGSKPV